MQVLDRITHNLRVVVSFWTKETGFTFNQCFAHWDGAQASKRSTSTVLFSPAVVGIAHILPTFQTYRIPPRRILAPGGGGSGGGVAMATSAPRLGVVLHGVCASCEPMQSAILISVPGEDCSSSSWLIHSGGVTTTFSPSFFPALVQKYLRRAVCRYLSAIVSVSVSS